MIGRVPFPNRRSGLIGLAIAGNPENGGHPPDWQEAIRREIVPATCKNDYTSEATTGLAPGFVGHETDIQLGFMRSLSDIKATVAGLTCARHRD
jgi:hypothetical protein